MQVTSANAQDRNFAKPVVADRPKRAESKPEPQPEQVTAQPTVAPETREERGVIRLLEEGHFKGVADVRLRINFFNELSAKAEQQAAASLPDDVGTVRDQTMAAFGELVSTLGLAEEDAGSAQQLGDDFVAAMNAAADTSVTNGQIDRAGLDSKLRAAFSALLTGLRELTAPPVIEQPADGIPVETPGETTNATSDPADTQPTATDVAVPAESTNPTTDTNAPELALTNVTESTPTDPFASLIKVFEDAVAGMQQSLAAGPQLPELTPPQNSGAAYEKFLAIYNNLLNPEQSETGEGSPSVEVSA